MNTIIITNDPQVAIDAENAGVSRVMLDLESIGKKQRQSSRDAFISNHKAEDISKIRPILRASELIVRINYLHGGTGQEIEHAISSGADIIMLPMINDLRQIEQVVGFIASRVKFMPLIETAYSMAHIEEIASNPAVDELYIGLNDLHLSLGLDFLFEPLALGLLDWMIERIKASGKNFGFGGIAAINSGEIPAEYILAEHVRLGSRYVILSSIFSKNVDIYNVENRTERIKKALDHLNEKTEELSKRSSEQIEADRRIIKDKIQQVVKRLRLS